MCSPKIREDLIPKIYQAAKKAEVPMTTWVNEVIEDALSNWKEDEGQGTKENESEKEEKKS